ncbi:gas vesicle protein [Streptomyces sp. A7024]|uniref:Gas vesicle protein n=1 Tax=Streptomyces coryli TaxID=1128680 RepID=A0A6G4U411_9ACTN|nr:gas vesicle protein GvpG [Streptomyces coryli]NGN66108.1 gas vesicle protein [Streptomyces coryli]
MGLLSELLKLPAAPVRGPLWVLRQVASHAEREFYNPAAIQRELADLERRLLADEIDEEEFERREGELLARLREGQARGVIS